MAEQIAANAGSAPASQNLEANIAANAAPAPANNADLVPAANTAEPAPANQTPPANTATPGPEPELGEKGKQELISLRKRAQRAEQEAAYLRGLAEGRQPVSAEPVVKPAQGPPVLENYQNYDDFLVAKAKFEFAIEQNQRDQEREAERTRRDQAKEIERVKLAYNERFRKTIEKYPDLPEVSQSLIHNPLIPPNPSMVQAIMESEVGPEIMYHLGQNVQDAMRIASLGPLAAAREIGKIESKLIVVPATEPQRITQAPEPIRAVGTKGAVISFDYETSSMDEYVKKRNAEAPPGRR